MANELPRQLVHLSGLLFIVVAQFTGGRVAGVSFLLIAAAFFLYAEYVRHEEKRATTLAHAIEAKFRDLVLHFETRREKRPFVGAFWFYTGCGITFLLFPLDTASLACGVLAVGDAVATLVGAYRGRTLLLPGKTLEGSAGFFASAFLSALIFVDVTIAVAVAGLATLVELLPALPLLRPLAQKGWVDDNLLIPLAVAVALTALL